MTKIVPQKIFKQAEFFYKACNIISNKINEGHSYLGVSYIINASISIEFYLKTLIFLETEKLANGHDLKKLWNKLSTESQRVCSTRYKFYVNSNPVLQKQREFTYSILGKVYPEELSDVLTEIRHAFIRNRYSYEEDTGSSFYDCPQIRYAILDRLKDFPTHFS